MTVSSVQAAVTRPNPTMGPHPLFRETAIRSFKWDVAAGNAAAATTTDIATLEANYAGLYGAILETGNNVSFAIFRIDNGFTITVLDDGGGVLAASAGSGVVAIVNNSGTLQINNQIGAGGAAAAVSVTIFRLATA